MIDYDRIEDDSIPDENIESSIWDDNDYQDWDDEGRYDYYDEDGNRDDGWNSGCNHGCPSHLHCDLCFPDDEQEDED